MRPAFRAHFDRSHWWEPQSKIEPGAALYELVRRHPLVGEHWLRALAALKLNHRKLGVRRGHPFFGQAKFSEAVLHPHWLSGRFDQTAPPSLHWTCLLGLKSCLKLDWTDQRNWEFSAGNLKGLDFRREEWQCRSIRSIAHSRIWYKREETLGDKVKGKQRGPEIGRIINEDLAAHPPTAKDWEAAIAEAAVEAYRDGEVLLAFAPDLSAEKAASSMAKKYREDLRLYPPPKSIQRARWKDWLPLISAFEDAEARTGGAKSQLFIRYRRAVDSVHFT